MIKEKIKSILKDDGNNKKKIENTIFLIIILVITIIIINFILKEKKDTIKEEDSEYKTLAVSSIDEELDNSNDLQKQLEKILRTIKGVGKVNVFINYSESSKTIAMYDEKTTTSSTEETDSNGGLRNTTSIQTQKDVIFSEKDGNQIPMTEKIIMPTIEGAIITATRSKKFICKKQYSKCSKICNRSFYRQNSSF